MKTIRKMCSFRTLICSAGACSGMALALVAFLLFWEPGLSIPAGNLLIWVSRGCSVLGLFSVVLAFWEVPEQNSMKIRILAFLVFCLSVLALLASAMIQTGLQQ